jgi:spermidine synthase
VRHGRGGRELRLDGTTASRYRPGSLLTGSVWDALAAPLLHLPPGRRGSVLLLGLGGGSAARVVRALAPAARIVGVEILPEMVEAARRWFDLDALEVEVVIEDARAYLAGCRERFDAVLDDVFVGSGRSPRKPPWLPEPGLGLAAKRLRPGGLLASNTLDETAAVARSVRRLFPARVRIDVAGYDNRIVVGGPADLSARRLRAELVRDPVFAPSARNLSLRTL